MREREQRGQFEGAAYTRRELDAFRLLVQTQRQLGWLFDLGNWVVFERAVDRTMVLAYAVCRGRLTVQARLHDIAEVEVFAERVRTALAEPAPSSSHADVEGMTILAAWLREPERYGGYVVPITDPALPPGQLGDWMEACRDLLARASVDARRSCD